MPSFPVPLIVAVVLGFMFLHMWLSERRHVPLAGLLGLCAAQALIISLNQHYGLRGMSTVQPLTATLIPPAAWLAFQMTADRHPERRDLVHLLGPAAALAALSLFPPTLDVLIPAQFAGYGLAVLGFSWRSTGLAHSIIEAGEWPRRIWQIIGVALIVSAMSDVLIVFAMVAGVPELSPWIVTIFMTGNLLVVGFLCLSGARVTDSPKSVTRVEELSGDDEMLMQRLEALMREGRPYLDPDLTLARLARKLRLPAKQVSAAVNRATGENISRYINAARIEAAKSALLEGETVTQAMFSCGFQTKSNFNREFLRIVGSSPTTWLRDGDHK
ncbi:MAG: helix-turn-helix domain-containing protein [Paracoccaceae bacterium]|nr:helix-turn-helix domain-containing protein [Paracoccaceae bacterium]